MLQGYIFSKISSYLLILKKGKLIFSFKYIDFSVQEKYFETNTDARVFQSATLLDLDSPNPLLSGDSLLGSVDRCHHRGPCG